ncbi:MAG TPA: GNAT family N-acetyltransferase, partial [Armatimonadota bacterium]
GFQLHGKFVHYKPTFDVDYWDCSPGDVLLRYLFQYAQDSDVREFDFTIGDEHYKRRFTNRIKDNCALHIDRYPARPASLVSRLVRRVQDKIRQNPELKTALKRHAWLLKDASSRVGRVFSRPNRLKRCISGIRSAFRTAVWSRDEVLFYSKPPQAAGETARGEVLAATLNDITRLSLEYPGFLNEAQLRESRTRLKQGELLFIGRVRNNEVATIWAQKRSEISMPEIGRECTVPLGSQVFVIYEIRTSPDFPLGDALSQILRAIAKEVAAEELWIYCLRRSQSLLRAIEEAGFQPRLCLSHHSFLHWFRRSSISPLIEGDGLLLDAQPRSASPSRMKVPAEEDSVNHGSL